jgi:hypothetical protein
MVAVGLETGYLVFEPNGVARLTTAGIRVADGFEGGTGRLRAKGLCRQPLSPIPGDPCGPRISVPASRLSGCASNSPAAYCARLKHATLFSPKNVSRPARPNRGGTQAAWVRGLGRFERWALRHQPTGQRRVSAKRMGLRAAPAACGQRGCVASPFRLSPATRPVRTTHFRPG